MLKAKLYDLTVLHVGSTAFGEDYSLLTRSEQEAGGAAWYARELERLPNRAGNCDLALVKDGKVYINARLLKTLASDDASCYYPVLRWGRSQWYFLTDPDLLERIRFHIAYERRTASQERVALRSRQIFDWLAGFVRGGVK